jgi:hypothetical protein
MTRPTIDQVFADLVRDISRTDEDKAKALEKAFADLLNPKQAKQELADPASALHSAIPADLLQSSDPGKAWLDVLSTMGYEAPLKAGPESPTVEHGFSEGFCEGFCEDNDYLAKVVGGLVRGGPEGQPDPSCLDPSSLMQKLQEQERSGELDLEKLESQCMAFASKMRSDPSVPPELQLIFGCLLNSNP